MNGNSSPLLLVQAPPWGVYTLPLGIAYLAEFLKGKSVPVEVFDLNIDLYRAVPAGLQAKWDTGDFEYWASGEVLKDPSVRIDGYIEKLLGFESDIIAFSATFASVPFLNRIAEGIKKQQPGVRIVVGGAGTFNKMHRDFFRREYIDYFIVGEGEEALYGLLQHLRQGQSDFIENRCRCWKDSLSDNTLCIRAESVCDVDRIPYPTFEKFDIGAYTEKDLLPIITSRGCINACHFCCDWPLKRPYRSRKPDSVIEEISFLTQRYNRRRFEFSDLLINGNLQFLRALCELLIKKELNIAWGGQAAVRAEMDANFYALLKRAGCGGLTFGFESFSDPLLQKMGKRFTADEAARAVRLAKEAGIQVEANLIVGFPGEEDQDIDATIAFLKNNRQFIDKVNSLNICSVGPGMTVFDRPAEFGIDKNAVTDWYAWHTADRSNTLEVRLARHERLKQFIQGERLGLVWQNIRKPGEKNENEQNDQPLRAVLDHSEDTNDVLPVPKPDSCILLMTLGCTLRCKMCNLWNNKEDRSAYPSLDTWKSFLDSADSFADKPFTVIFGGGEPLIEKEKLIPLIAYAHNKGFRTSLATSGYFMTEPMVRQLCEAGLDYIAFTLYSLEARKQDFLRGVKGSVKVVQTMIDLFARYRPDVEIAIDTVIMEPNRRHLVKLTKWVQQNKDISRIMFQAVMQPFHTKPLPEWYKDRQYSFLWPKNVRKIVKVIDTLRTMQQAEDRFGGGKISNSPGQFDVFKQYFMHPEHFIKSKVCPTAGNRNFGVGPDGSVTLCPYMGPIGNIKESSLEQIWYSPNANQRRNEIRSCHQNCHHIVNCWYEEEHVPNNCAERMEHSA